MATAAPTLPLAVETARAAARPRPRWVAAWIWTLVALVLLMVAIGGATRLTGSGLSITEWKPVTGAVPPLSAESWDREFGKYRGSSQYRNLNRGMELPEFKRIYWWEWSHRQLGRLIGIAFVGPLLVFWLTGLVGTSLALKLLGIGGLGALQATVGWIMVASGLEPGMVAVAPLKLMLHLVLASAILALLVWTATGLSLPPRRGGRVEAELRYPPSRAGVGTDGRDDPTPGGASRLLGPPLGGGIRVPLAPAVLLALVVLQIALGGLVAGSRAGWTYNTWPLMDGRLVPPAEALTSVSPLVENLVDNPALVQLNHRLTAYLLVGFAVWHAWSVRRRRPGSGAAHRAAGLAALALAQMALGVATLILVVPLWAGLAHQLLAMALMVAATLHLRLSGSRPA